MNDRTCPSCKSPRQKLRGRFTDCADCGARVKAWFNEPDNVHLLARWLVEQGNTGKDIQRYYEKPWNYCTEWNQMHGELMEAKP